MYNYQTNSLFTGVVSKKLSFFQVKFFLFFIFLSLSQLATAGESTSKHCDSIIKKGIELMFQKKHLQSIELLSEAKAMAKKNKWYQQMFLAQNNVAINYYLMLDYGEALKQYLESYNISKKYLEDKYSMIVLNNIAILYSKEEKYTKAIEYFYKAYTMAKKNKDSLKIGMYALNLGNVANDENKTDKARKYFEESMRYSQRSELEIPLKIGLCQNDFLSGKITKSRVSASSLLLKIKDKPENIDNRISLKTIVAKSYLKENNLSPALKWTLNALSDKPNLENKAALMELLSAIYFKLKSYDLAFRYKDSVIAVRNEINDVKKSKLFESNSVKFQLQDYKEKVVEKESKISNQRKIFYSILTVIVFGVVIIILVFRNRLIENRRKQLMALNEQRITEINLEKEIANNLLLEERGKRAALEQERLKNEIALKNQKILSKQTNQFGRNLLLKDILKSIASIPGIKENKDVVTYMEALKQHIKNDENWESYVRHFDDVNQDFIKKLMERHPDLTITDIRYISYVYMNLDTKEIASMLNITPVACRKRKERIEKRLNLTEKVSLNAYLLSI
jgi:hypothetical protein